MYVCQEKNPMSTRVLVPGIFMSVIYTSFNTTSCNCRVCFTVVVTTASLTLPLALEGLQNRQFWFKQRADQQLTALPWKLLLLQELRRQSDSVHLTQPLWPSGRSGRFEMHTCSTCIASSDGKCRQLRQKWLALFTNIQQAQNINKSFPADSCLAPSTPTSHPASVTASFSVRADSCSKS